MKHFDTRPRGVGPFSLAVPAWIAAASVFIQLTAATPAPCQAVIKVNEDVNIRLGVLGQFQADWLEEGGTGSNPNLFVRRLRLLFGGQVAKNVSFFVDTDVPNLGKKLPTGKNITPSVIVQDAYAEVRAGNWLMVNAGLMFVPFSRSSIQSAATLLALDYGAYTFAQSGPTQSSTGRDTGFQARGYVFDNRLEYRIGAFQGAHRQGLDPSLRYTGRVQYQFLDPEGTGFFYAGTHLGTRRVFAVGAAFDVQDDYRGYDLDLFADHPAGPGALTAQILYNHFDGGATLPALLEQDIAHVELGYLFPRLRLTPVLQMSWRDGKVANLPDETRWSVGLNFWWQRHNANVKAAYGRIEPDGLPTQEQFTIQLQLFYF